MLTVITGWSPKCWRDYAFRFAKTFGNFFSHARVIAYTEEPQQLPGIEVRSLWSIPGVRDFIEQYKDDRRANGKEPGPKWKESARKAGYNFRYDAVRFCRQGFIPYHALMLCDTEYMAWFDADVVATRAIPDTYITGLLPQDKDVAYLGRGDKHSEIGFQLYSNRDGAFNIAGEFARLYYERDIFNLKEWHSAYAFDHAVASMTKKGKANAHDITPGGYGDVWFRSPLIKFSDHLKGKRKYAPSIHRL